MQQKWSTKKAIPLIFLQNTFQAVKTMLKNVRDDMSQKSEYSN
jgi:hypothetical protein